MYINNDIDEEHLKYSVGALLYSPANSDKILRQISEKRIEPPYSVALCLEDAIADDSVEAAEECLINTLKSIKELSCKPEIYIPKIFVRVRSSEQAVSLFERFGNCTDIFFGFIFPKYTVSNADGYNNAMRQINSISDKKIYMMPILESIDILSVLSRQMILTELKDKIDSVKEFVLNIRVGRNDFCNCYGLRRNVNQTIYDIGMISSCLCDIANVFSSEYVVSAPVWEYFDTGSDDKWKQGLNRELELDRLNGFIGKTAVHPSQVSVINNSLKISVQDYNDAMNIINWKSKSSGVEKVRNTAE